MKLEGFISLFVRGVGVVEGGRVPLLETDLGIRTFVAEEENVIVCDEGGEVLGVLERGREVGLVVAYPAGSVGHGGGGWMVEEPIVCAVIVEEDDFDVLYIRLQATSGLRMCGEERLIFQIF